MSRLMLFVIAVAFAVSSVAHATPSPGDEEFAEALETLYRVGEPTWQPNGDWILFVRYAPGDGPMRIYKVRADGTGLTAITPEWYANPIWSPDGTKFACVGGTETTDELYVLDLNGNHLRSLGTHTGFLCFEGWSPDGGTIAFRTRRGDGGPYVALMTDTGAEIRFVCTGYSASWHPSGRYLAVEDRVGLSPVMHLFEVDVQTKQRRQITSEGRSPSYSPDGEWIAFWSARPCEGGRCSGIWLVRRDGSELRPLVVEGDEEEYAYTPACFSPDGQYLVFGRGKWVETDLYICRIDGTGLRKITNFYPDETASGKSTLKMAKTPVAPKADAGVGQSPGGKNTSPLAKTPASPAKRSQPAKPAEKREKGGVPFPWLAPPIPVRKP